MADFTIRRAASYDDYHALQDAQRRAWGITSDGYVVPVATMVGAQLHGGLVLGAFLADGSAVGLSFAFLGRSEGHLCLYSQLTGVAPGQQGQGIGEQLKRVQWEIARAQGVPLLAWAFDPLQAGNAHFNLVKLGAAASRFIENMYGPRTDALNAGVPTDRLIVEWSTAHTVHPAASGEALTELPRVIATRARPDGLLAAGEPIISDAEPRLLLEIPEEIGRMARHDAALASGWRHAVRTGFQAAFAAGYRATGFVRQGEPGQRRCFYLLEQHGG